jgi:pimeloyl-ACP methyl ester carboxylesterase
VGDGAGQAAANTITVDWEGGPFVADVYPSPRAGDIPVVLIHGWGGSGRYWGGLVKRLGTRWGFVVPDLPGVGRSLPVQRAHTMEDHVRAVEALLDHVGIERVHIVAHSMGAGIAMLLAAKRPALIERLVLTSISLFRTERERVTFIGITMLLALQMRVRAKWMADVPFLTRLAARRYFYRIPGDKALLRAGFVDYLHMDLGTAVASARSAASYAIPDAARRIRVPSLLVVGRNDSSLPLANVEYTGGMIPGCEVRLIERCGHLPMVEWPDLYAALVDEFLGRERIASTGVDAP